MVTTHPEREVPGLRDSRRALAAESADAESETEAVRPVDAATQRELDELEDDDAPPQAPKT